MALLRPASTLFVTGASGFIGSHLTRELTAHGHKVVGLAQSDASAAKIESNGGTALRGDLDDLDILQQAAADSDGVVHLAFKHSELFSGASTMADLAKVDGQVIKALGAGLGSSTEPFVLASGTLVVAGQPGGRIATERDGAAPGAYTSPRAASLDVLKTVGQSGPRTIEMRFSPSTHGPGDKGFLAFLTKSARAAGIACYPGDGSSRWTGVNVADAASLIRLALECAPSGSVMHAIESEGISQRDIATALGERYKLPVQSVPADQIASHFGMMAHFVSLDGPCSSTITQEITGWQPTHPTLIQDILAGVYDSHFHGTAA